MSDILFENLGKFEYAADDFSQKELESEYLNHYIKSSTQINDKNAWKNRGFGASFRSDEANDDQAKKNIQAAVNGIALAEDGEFFYSITVNEMSGIFRKSITAAKDSETHVIHASDMEFYDVDYSRKSRLLAASLKSDSFAQNIALFDLQQGDYHILTDGDSMDRHPYFSQSRPNTVLFDSSGIGRDSSGNFVEYGPASLYRIDTLTNQIEELASREGVSFVCPKDDVEGNLYYIERPAKYKEKKPNILLEILLIPFKIIYAIYRFLEAFTMLFTGKTFTSNTSGNNPAKNRNERDIFIEGNLIEAEKNLKKSRKRGEKFPGIAPQSWKLMLRRPDGESETLMNGVIAFDLDDEGNLIFTNGKNVLLRKKNGSVEKISDASLCRHVSAYHGETQVNYSIF